MSEQQSPGIPLSEMIESLRGELQESIDKAKEQDLKFAVEEINLELQVAVTSKVGGEGKFNFGVVSFGGSGGETRQDVHTFKLKLKPVLPSPTPGPGEVVLASNPEVKISGKVDSSEKPS